MAQTQNNNTSIKKVASNKKTFTSIKKNIFKQKKIVFKCIFLSLKYIFAFKHFFSLIETGFFDWKYIFWLKQPFFWLNNKDTNLPP